jgi:hypothetical protein
VDASGNRIPKDYEITAQQSNCAKEPAGSILKNGSSTILVDDRV